MVFRKDDKGGGWHEPPYTWEEEMEFYRSYNAGMASGEATVWISEKARGPAAKSVPEQRSEEPVGQAAPRPSK
jgi:hypothetical protein